MAWYDSLSEEEIQEHENTLTTHIVIDGVEIQVNRCITDGGIVINTQESMRMHGGHRCKQPVLLNRNEIERIIREVRKGKDLFKSYV